MGEAPADNTKEIVVQTAVDNLTVDNLNGVTSDLTLADTAGYGTVVTWESSEPSVIRNDGTVTPAAEDKTVTLTAEVALGNVTDTKVFTAFVPAEGGKPICIMIFPEPAERRLLTSQETDMTERSGEPATALRAMR